MRSDLNTKKLDVQMLRVTLSLAAYLAVNIYDWQYVIVEILRITNKQL